MGIGSPLRRDPLPGILLTRVTRANRLPLKFKEPRERPCRKFGPTR